ncbi:MAG: hypothetical protein ACXWFC_11060 [Nitrososphaeraceae archaeon]
MKYTKKSYQLLIWKPTPIKIPVERNLEIVGNILSSNQLETMDIPLHPKINEKGQRKIDRICRNNKRGLEDWKKEFKLRFKGSKDSEYISNVKVIRARCHFKRPTVNNISLWRF